MNTLIRILSKAIVLFALAIIVSQQSLKLYSSTNQHAPNAYMLAQNFPNPFNPVTSIRYTLAADGMTTLAIYNLLGQKVAVPVNEWQGAGEHSIRFDASGIGSGIYFYKLESGRFSQTRRMIVTK